MMIHKVQEAELDEMWSLVGRKKHPWWLWEALDHQTGRIVAYTFGRRADRVLLKLKALLEPFGIHRFYTDGWAAYRRSNSRCTKKGKRSGVLVARVTALEWISPGGHVGILARCAR